MLQFPFRLEFKSGTFICNCRLFTPGKEHINVSPLPAKIPHKAI